MGEKQKKHSLESDLPVFKNPEKKKFSFFKHKVNNEEKEIKLRKSLDKKINPSKILKFVDGNSAKTLLELKENLISLSDISFKQHVNKKNNDISEWVKNNFDFPELAKKLEKSKSKKSMIKVLEKYIPSDKILSANKISQLPELPELKEKKSKKKQNVKIKDDILPPSPPKNYGGKLAGILPSLEDSLIPPEPTKDMLVKKQKNFGNPKKTKEEHREIDMLITREQEEKRHNEKKEMLFRKEKELKEKELNLAETEKAHVRQEEKISSLKKIFDHDVRQRINHVMTKDEELKKLKKDLEEEKKNYEEKDKIMDKLRQRYLTFISRESELVEKEREMEKKQEELNNSIKKLQDVNSSINHKFNDLKELNTQINTEWKSKFSNFANLNQLLELKEKELIPKISKLHEDIILFTNKEKILDKKYDIIKEKEKQLKDFDNKKEEYLKSIEKLREMRIHLDERTSSLDNQEKELKKKIDLINKNKELKEDTKTLKDKLLKVEKILSNSSLKILNLPDLEKKNEELKKRSYILDEKAKELMTHLHKIEKNKELKEDTKALKDKLLKVEKSLKEKTAEVINLEDKIQKLKSIESKIDSKKAKIERLEKNIEEEKKTLSEKQKTYEKQMESMMDNKFHSYLENTIKKTQTQLPKDKDYKHNQIYILIDNCRDLIDLGKTLEAKKLYNKIRLLFIELDLKGTEQQILKETIKELYNQIKLSSLR